MLGRLAKTLLYFALFFVCMPLVAIVGALLASIIPVRIVQIMICGMTTAAAFGLPKLLGDLIVKYWERIREGRPIFKRGTKDEKPGNTSIIRRECLPGKDTPIHKDQADVCENYSSDMMQRTGWWKCDQCGRENASYTSSCACGNPKRRVNK